MGSNAQPAMPAPQPAILIIVENLPVPFDRRVWQEALALAEAGYRVAVISPKGRGFESSQENIEGIEIYRHRLWEAASPRGYLFEYAWALMAEFYLALRIYRRIRFRVLHACNPPDILFLIAAFFKFFGTRFVFDHHDLNPELFEAKFGRRGWLYRLVRLAERLTFRTADVSIAPNESYREIAIERGGMKPDRVWVVRSSPDLARIRLGEPRPELKEGRAYLVTYHGVMGPQEGLDLLLEAIADVVSQRSDVLFALIGGGTERERLRERANKMQLRSFVRFPGRVSEEDLAAYLSTADVSVAPDPQNPMNDKSTMNKVLEAMAYARPLVLFDLTEGRRAAGDAALYARPNDPADFARQMLRLLNSAELRRELAARGRKRIEQELNWDREKLSLKLAYQKVLEG